MRQTCKNCLAPSILKVLDKDFRNFYRKKTKNNIKKRLHHYDNDRIIRLFLKKVGDKMIENRSGVLINRIGYFFVYKHPFIFRTRIGMKHLKRYIPTFIPIENSIFKYWSMDFKFSTKIVNGIDNRIKNGYRYLNLMNGINKSDYIYLGASNRAITEKNNTYNDKI